jgi:type IV pilus assembly protein PilA
MHHSVRARGRGFTLIEIMIAVVIVGVLATLAIVGFSKWFGKSHMAEATELVNEIRRAQEHYKGEVQHYADVSKGFQPGANHLYPSPSPGAFVTQWGAPCAWCNVDWTVLTAKAHDPVMFGYATQAGTATCDPASCKSINFTQNGQAIDLAGLAGGKVTGPWYAAFAVGDTNGNGKYCRVMGTSFTNQLWIDQEGE